LSHRVNALPASCGGSRSRTRHLTVGRMNSLGRLQLAVFTEVAERSRPASNQPLAADRKWPFADLRRRLKSRIAAR